MLELANITLDEFHENGLYQIVKDDSGVYNVEKVKLSQEKYEQLKSIYKGLDEAGRTPSEYNKALEEAKKWSQINTTVKTIM